MKGLSKKIYNYNFYLFIGKYMLNDSQNNEKETFEFIKTLSDDNQKIQYLNKIDNEKYKCLIIISLSTDAKKIQYLDELTDEWLKVCVIRSLNDEEKKIQYLNRIDNEKYKMNIIVTLSTDAKKIQYLDELTDEWLKVCVIRSLNDDEKKIQYLNKVNDEEYKKEIIVTLSNDDKKIQCLNKLTDEELKVCVIKSLNDDEKKIQYLNKIDNELYKYNIIESLSTDAKKIQYLNKIDNELYKYNIIKSLSTDAKKIQYLDELTDEWLKVCVIRKLNDDDQKIQCLDKLTDEWLKVCVIRSLNDDEKKIQYLNKIDNEKYKAEIIVTLSNDDKKILYLDKLTDEWLKVCVIRMLNDEEKKIQFLDKFDDKNKCEIINSFEPDEKRILLMNMCITNKYYWNDVIANLKLFESDGYLVAKKFADYIVSNNYEITYELIKSEKDKYMPIFERITLSNSMEIQNIDIKGLISVYNSDESIDKKEFNKKIDSIENIFLKNNLPPYAKTYLCFRSIYPEFSKKYSGRELFDFEDKSRMAPSLLDSSMDKIFDNKIGLYFSKPNDKRFVTISNDLFNISLKSNNFELKEYIENLEIGNNLLNKIIMKEVDYNSLNEKEKFQYDMFSSHIDMLYEISNKNKLDKNFNNEKEKLEFIKNEFVGKGKYGLLDSITRYYLYFAGYKTFNQLKNDVFNECNLINEKNSKDVIENFKISQGDLIRCIGNIDCIGSVLNYGNVCKEYLGTFTGTSESDTTPLDTDWTYITGDDVSNNNYNTISGTPTGFGFGDVFVIIKDVKNNPNIEISRDIDGKVRDFKYDPKKYEAFATNTEKGGYKNHWGIRTGTGTEIIDSIIYNNENLEKIDALKMELAKNNTYIPVYSMEGKLIYSPDEFKEKRNLVSGIKRYDSSEYKVSNDLNLPDLYDENNNLIIPGIESIKKMKKQEFKEVEQYKVKVFDHLKKWITNNTNSNIVKDNLSLELKYGEADLIGIGSTARGTNLPNDYDYDYYLRLDKRDLYTYDEKNCLISNLQNLEKNLNEYLNPSKNIPGKEGRVRGTGIHINGLKKAVDIDVTFTQKTNKTTYSTDMALEERLNNIKENNSDKYEDVIANIVLAKYVLKKANCYKPDRSDSNQGGIGGVGVENWILQNGGSFKNSCLEFLSAATIDGQMVPFNEFKQKYFIWDLGENRENRNEYPFDNFINNMNESGYKKMYNALSTYVKNLSISNEKNNNYKII